MEYRLCNCILSTLVSQSVALESVDHSSLAWLGAVFATQLTPRDVVATQSRRVGQWWSSVFTGSMSDRTARLILN